MTEMLLEAQNAIGELSLEIGTTQKGIQYFQKAWPKLMDFLEDDQDLVKQEASQLLISDSSHHVMIEAVGYLYRSFDLRATYLGSSHSSAYGILQHSVSLESYSPTPPSTLLNGNTATNVLGSPPSSVNLSWPTSVFPAIAGVET
ncbi:Tetratricopeptide Repeat Protein 41-Like [Manis pentadactyla]|nr:Tetratricopeptide Repeat Protein 41-Like [Manis pentadactyla]